MNLQSKLLCRHKDDGPWLSILSTAQFLKDREQIGPCFPCAGLCHSNQVLPGKNPRNGLGLYGRWMTVTQRINGVQNCRFNLRSSNVIGQR